MFMNQVRSEGTIPFSGAGNQVFSHSDLLSCIFYRVLVDRPTDCPNLSMVSKACYHAIGQRSLWKAIFASPTCRLPHESHYMREPFCLPHVLPLVTRKSLREIGSFSEPEPLVCLITSLNIGCLPLLPELVGSLVSLLADDPKYRNDLPPSLRDGPLWYVYYVGGRDVILCQSAVLCLLDLRDPKNIVCTVLGREHTHPIDFVQDLQDGRIVTSDQSGAMFLWDLKDLETPCVGNLHGYQEPVCFVQSFQDGRLITSDRSHKTLIWDFKNPEEPCVGSLSGHKRRISSVHELQDGRILTVDSSNRILAWDLSVENTGNFYLGRLDGFEGGGGYIRKVSYLEDRVWIIDSEGKSLLWNLNNLKKPPLQTPVTVGDEVRVIQFTSDSRFWMMHRRGDSLVYSFWSENDFEVPSAQLVVPSEHNNSDFFAQNGWAALGSFVDDLFCFWHPTAQCPTQERFKWNPFPGVPEYRLSFAIPTQAFAFDYADFGFLTQSHEGTISLWDPRNPENLMVANFSEMPPVNKITRLQGGRSLLCCADGSLYLLDLSTPDNPTLKGPLDQSCGRATPLDGDRFVVWRTDQTIWVGDARHPEEPLFELPTDASTAVKSVRVLPNGLLAAQSDEELNLWNIDEPSTPILFQTIRPTVRQSVVEGVTPTIQSFYVLAGGQLHFSLQDGGPFVTYAEWI